MCSVRPQCLPPDHTDWMLCCDRMLRGLHMTCTCSSVCCQHCFGRYWLGLSACCPVIQFIFG